MGLGIGIGLGLKTSAIDSAFSPTSISGLVAWYDATYGITLNGSKVSGWANKAGTGGATWDLAQANAAFQPTYLATGSRNSAPAVEFKVAGAITRMDTGAGAIIAAAPFTILALAKRQDTAAAGQRIWDSLAVPNEATIYDTIGTNIKMYAPVAEITSTATYAAGNWYRLLGVFNAASSVLRVDGTETTGTVGTAAISAGFRVGCMGTGVPGATAWDGELVHLLVYSGVVGATDRTALFTWLATQ